MCVRYRHHAVMFRLRRGIDWYDDRTYQNSDQYLLVNNVLIDTAHMFNTNTTPQNRYLCAIFKCVYRFAGSKLPPIHAGNFLIHIS